MLITGKINRQFPRRNNACSRQLICVRYGSIVRSTVKHIIAGICTGQPNGIDNILRSYITRTIIGNIFTAVNGTDIVPVHIDFISANEIRGIRHIDFIVFACNDLPHNICSTIIRLGNERRIVECQINLARRNGSIVCCIGIPNTIRPRSYLALSN